MFSSCTVSDNVYRVFTDSGVLTHVGLVQLTAAISPVSYHHFPYFVGRSYVNLPPTSHAVVRACAAFIIQSSISIAINRSTCLVIFLHTWLFCGFPQSQILRPINFRLN